MAVYILMIKLEENEEKVAEQVRIPMEKDKDGKDITPAYEEFIKNGTVRKHRVTTGDNLTDDIHQVGIISSRRMSAQETLKIKRNHWKIENSLHHVLDDLFREDRSSARKSKNHLAVIRKIAYNLLRIAILREKIESGPTEMRDQFNDDLTLIEKYVFKTDIWISAAEGAKAALKEGQKQNRKRVPTIAMLSES